jgi:hypothetical protein
MVKTVIHCLDCDGRIEVVRDLERDSIEIEEFHAPGCPASGPRPASTSMDVKQREQER